MAKAAHRAEKDGGPLQEAWKRYEAGDQVGARREAKRALEGPLSEAERAEAQDLLARSRPPTFVWPYAAAAAVVLALMLALAIARG